jgi:hypothetical protein
MNTKEVSETTKYPSILSRTKMFLLQAYEGSERDVIFFIFMAASIVYAALSTIALALPDGLSRPALFVLLGIYLLFIVMEVINIETGNLMLVLKKHGLFRNYEPFSFENLIGEEDTQ